MEHTPEPWGVETTDTTLWVGPMRHGGKVEDVVTAIDCNVHHYKREYLDKQRANARRIVACVNALSGISTEAIEAGAVKGLAAAAKEAQYIISRYRSFLGTITSAEVELHPYIPSVEDVDEKLIAALSQLEEASK